MMLKKYLQKIRVENRRKIRLNEKLQKAHATDFVKSIESVPGWNAKFRVVSSLRFANKDKATKNG